MPTEPKDKIRCLLASRVIDSVVVAGQKQIALEIFHSGGHISWTLRSGKWLPETLHLLPGDVWIESHVHVSQKDCEFVIGVVLIRGEVPIYSGWVSLEENGRMGARIVGIRENREHLLTPFPARTQVWTWMSWITENCREHGLRYVLDRITTN